VREVGGEGAILSLNCILYPGADLVPAARQLLQFAQEQGASTLTFEGTYANKAIAMARKWAIHLAEPCLRLGMG
jgi:hypothetical protein